tara:strand:+ start:83 stop:367 length:285 start_codon:yes stop_codon:yes gene_type:complete
MKNTRLVEKLAVVATVVGLIKIAITLRNIREKRDVRSYTVPSTTLGLLTSGVWMWYDIAKGLKMGAATAGATVCLDTYILYLLLQERRRKDKRG